MARTFEITTEGNAAKIVVDGNEISENPLCADLWYNFRGDQKSHFRLEKGMLT